MNRRKRNRRKRILIAYAARTLCALIIIGIVVLMGCGCLYIYEHAFQNKKESTQKDETQKDTNDNAEDNNSDNQGEDSQNPEDGDAAATSGSITPFTYPDASGLYIVLDAGHGGGDGGTVGEKAVEKDINLSVVLKMKALLEDCGAEVLLTRDSDERVSLSDRNYIANQTNADLFVSIHCNSFEDDATISGMECYYHKSSETSKTYAQQLIQIAQRIGNIETRYEQEQNYQVLRDSSMPALLIEMGYLSNTTNCQNLLDTNYQDTMAQTIVEAIVEILKTSDSGATS